MATLPFIQRARTTMFSSSFRLRTKCIYGNYFIQTLSTSALPNEYGRFPPQQPPSDPSHFQPQGDPPPQYNPHPHNQTHTPPNQYPYNNHNRPITQNPNSQKPNTPNRWNNQNQWNPRTQGSPAPQRGNPNQFQNPSQLNDQAPVQVQAPSPTIVDLARLCQEGKVKKAIELINKGVKAYSNCFDLLFDLCGQTKSLEDAKKVHDYFLQSTCRGDFKLNNKVIEMYGNCKSMTDARRVFDHMPNRNMDSWNMMMCGYANNTVGDEALQLFERMNELGLEITSETLLTVLSACASVEAVEDAYLHFESMKSKYGIEPRVEHYMGLLDVLGQAGYLKEAEKFIEELQFEPTVTVWETLKNYARIHGDIDLEDHAEELIVSLDPSKSISNKIPMPPPKKYTAISMLDGKNRIIEVRDVTRSKIHGLKHSQQPEFIDRIESEMYGITAFAAIEEVGVDAAFTALQ
ncbi:Tetratricopeptide-like helical domain superfamily [Sesbania bispinosa]|nr:Tetratricopeptide-like helical domain superfamily [Sesbania bispinosa]